MDGVRLNDSDETPGITYVPLLCGNNTQQTRHKTVNRQQSQSTGIDILFPTANRVLNVMFSVMSACLSTVDFAM